MALTGIAIWVQYQSCIITYIYIQHISGTITYIHIQYISGHNKFMEVMSTVDSSQTLKHVHVFICMYV